MVMSLSLHEQALTAFLSQLQKSFSPHLEQVILFGSYSKGEALSDSDIDILIIISDEDFSLRRAIISLSAEIFLQYAVDISPKVLSLHDFELARKKNNLFIQKILSEGEIIV